MKSTVNTTFNPPCFKTFQHRTKRLAGTLLPSGEPAMEDKVSERAASSTPLFEKKRAESLPQSCRLTLSKSFGHEQTLAVTQQNITSHHLKKKNENYVTSSFQITSKLTSFESFEKHQSPSLLFIIP